MGWLDRLKPSAKPRPSAAPDVKGAPGTRVYHEYFVDEHATNGRHVWLCRVYAADGTAHEMTGSEETNPAAAQSAISWAESVKATLRGKE